MDIKGLDYAQLKRILDAIVKEKLTNIEEVRDFVIKDEFWRNGEGWIGFQPSMDDEFAAEQFENLKVGFTPKNEVKPCVERPTAGVLGNEPDWNIIFKGSQKEKDVKALDSANVSRQESTVNGVALPTKKPKLEVTQTDRFKAMDDANVNWWDEKKALEHLQNFAANLLTFGKGNLKFYLPSAKLRKFAVQKENSKAGILSIKKMSYEDAIDCTFIESLPPEKAVITTETYSMEEFGITESYTPLKVTELASQLPTIKNYELCYLDDKGMTRITVFSENQLTPDGKPVINTQQAMNLKGKLFVYEATFDSIISKSVCANQKLLNFANTMQAYMASEFGFPETDYSNTNLPVMEVKGANGKSDEVIDWSKLPRGIGAFRALYGIKYQDYQGGEHFTEPKVTRHEPVDTDIHDKLINRASVNILEMCHQLWVKMSDDATASGESRIQALVDFILLLIRLKNVIDKAGKWVLEVLTMIGINLSTNAITNAKTLDSFYVIFDSKLYVGKMSADERRLMLEEVAAKTRSVRSYQIAAGVTSDPAAETRKIDEEQAVIIERTLKANNIMGQIGINQPAPGKKQPKVRNDKKTADTTGGK